MLRVVRHGDRHDPKELTVSFKLEGDFASAYREGRTDAFLTGEALKNLTYRVVRSHGTGEIEEMGLAICDRVLAAHSGIARVRVDIAEQSWARLDPGGKAHGQAFMAGPPERKTAAVTSNGSQLAVVSGIEQLTLMRTAGFAPEPRHDADDGRSDGLQRLLVGTLVANWTYSSADVTFRPYRQGVRAAVVETFAWHASRSVHHTLHAIADVVLASYLEIAEISLALHERPYRTADPLRADVEHPDDLFVTADDPVGVVEVTVEREGA
jgi:urate oxidase